MRHGIFSVDNPKTLKGESLGYLTLILHFIPSDKNSHGVDLCPFASKECIALCLNDSGLGAVLPSVQKARIKKTDLFLSNRVDYLRKMTEEIQSYQTKAKKENLKLCIRLNGTSDIFWSKLNYQGKNIFQHFPTVQFYDYTKNPFILFNSAKIKNYHVTFSWSGENEKQCRDMIEYGYNVAIPFQVKKGQPLPEKFLGRKVVDGDVSDLRFLDRKNVVVGLRTKGNKQRKTTEGNFIIQIERKKAS